jgi:hypothetical protein
MDRTKILSYIISVIFSLFWVCYSAPVHASDDVQVGFTVPAYVDEQTGDTMPNLMLRPIYVFPKLVFKN